MLSIGEFSKVTGLTVKTLRLYDEKGLLPPTMTAADSGYRYYDPACADRARVIKRLRELDLSLEEIAEILRMGGDDADIVSILERHAAVIEERLTRFRNIHQALNTIITTEREAQMIAKTVEFNIEEKVLGKVLVAGIRATGRYDQSGARFGALGRALGMHINGKPLNLIYDSEYKENDADFESCMPVRKSFSKPGIQFHELDGGKAVSLLHRGSYHTIGESYCRVFDYVRSRQWTVRSPTREVYIKGPGMVFRGNPQKYLTEIQVLVDG
jgi:DNA-binding transcriptional MerR regulator